MLYYVVRMFPIKARADFAVLTVLPYHHEIEIIMEATKSVVTVTGYMFFFYQPLTVTGSMFFLHRAGGKILFTSWITVKWEGE